MDKENLSESVITRPGRENALGTLRSDASGRARERSGRTRQIVEAGGGGRGSSASSYRPSESLQPQIDATATPLPEPAEDEIHAELDRTDAVGVKTDIVLMATAEALRDALETIDDLSARVEALEAA